MKFKIQGYLTNEINSCIFDSAIYHCILICSKHAQALFLYELKKMAYGPKMIGSGLFDDQESKALHECIQCFTKLSFGAFLRLLLVFMVAVW